LKTLSVNYYFYILKILEGMGLDRSDVAHIVPFDLENQTHPSVRLKMEALQSLFAFAATKLQDPHIGLHVSHNFRISNYGYAGKIYALCETIEHSMSMTRKYGYLAHSFGTFSPKPDIISDTVIYIWSPSFESDGDERYRHITECVMSNYALTINWLSWSFAKSVQKITFRHNPTMPLSEYSKILNCEIEFGASENSIILDKASHTTPLPTANPIKLSSLQNMLNKALDAYNLKSNLTGRVKYSLYNMIEHQRPSLALIAKDISMTERTLKRQLKNEGTRFQTILRSVKMDLCASYMREGIPLSEIAQRLWYFDQSALTRAYKKWYGVPPTRSKELV